MTVLAGVLIIGGLLLTILFVVGVVLFFTMLIGAEVSYAKAHRETEPSAAPEPLRAPAQTAPQPTRIAG